MRFGSRRPAIRQRQIEIALGTFAGEPPESNGLAGNQCLAQTILEVEPEADGRRMSSAPFTFEGFDFAVSVAVARVEATICAETAAEAKSQIAGFPDLAAGLVLRRDNPLQDPPRGHAIRLQRRVAGAIESPHRPRASTVHPR